MKRKYSDDDLVREFPLSDSLSQLATALGLAQAGGSLRYLKHSCERLGLNWRSKRNQGWANGKNLGSRGREFPEALLFCRDSSYLGSSVRIKQRATELGYIKNYCEICGQAPFWNNKEMVLILDHIDGDRKNNSPENLRSICANCDIQLPTSRGRNATLRKDYTDKQRRDTVESFAKPLAEIEDRGNRTRIEEILEWVQRSFPGLSPKIAWSQPMFTDHGTFIVGFSTSKKHLSVTPEKAGIDRFSEEIVKSGYDHGSMTFRIPWNKPVDYDLLERIIRFNIEDKKGCATFWRRA